MGSIGGLVFVSDTSGSSSNCVFSCICVLYLQYNGAVIHSKYATSSGVKCLVLMIMMMMMMMMMKGLFSMFIICHPFFSQN